VCADSYNRCKNLTKPYHTKDMLKLINVGRYNFTELTNTCSYYMSTYFVNGSPESKVEELAFLTGSVPGRVFNELAIF
jgi:hypothetical protein